METYISPQKKIDQMKNLIYSQLLTEPQKEVEEKILKKEISHQQVMLALHQFQVFNQKHA